MRNDEKLNLVVSNLHKYVLWFFSWMHIKVANTFNNTEQS